ncbi:MAG: hypothetical protein KF810_24130, partial [Rhizobiaceae bacterium]|nr:hypothetical protein [Rhizobiaceae bacterium]
MTTARIFVAGALGAFGIRPIPMVDITCAQDNSWGTTTGCVMTSVFGWWIGPHRRPVPMTNSRHSCDRKEINDGENVCL